MMDFITAASSSSSGQANILKAPKIEHVEKIHSTDNIIRYVNIKKNYASGVSIVKKESVSFPKQTSNFQISNVMERNIEIILLKVSQLSINSGFGIIDDEVILYSKKALLYINKKGVRTHNVYALDEGGVSIEVQEDDKYFNISFFNDGIGSLIENSKNKMIQAWELNFEELIKKIETTI